MNKQRLYFDTSVFGGVFDTEFETLSLRLFDKVKCGSLICVYSELTEGELHNAPQKVKNLLESLPNENKEYVQITDEALSLARQYISEKVVGETSFDDCLHIALATIHKVDVLVCTF